MAKILVVDDNFETRKAIVASLIEQGHAVTSTNNGGDALCLLGSTPPPDLLVLDLVMPLIDGHEVLKSLGPTGPAVVVISGDVVTVDETSSANVVRVLAKPFDQTALLDAVNWALSHPKMSLHTPEGTL